MVAALAPEPLGRDGPLPGPTDRGAGVVGIAGLYGRTDPAVLGLGGEGVRPGPRGGPPGRGPNGERETRWQRVIGDSNPVTGARYGSGPVCTDRETRGSGGTGSGVSVPLRAALAGLVGDGWVTRPAFQPPRLLPRCTIRCSAVGFGRPDDPLHPHPHPTVSVPRDRFLTASPTGPAGHPEHPGTRRRNRIDR